MLIWIGAGFVLALLAPWIHQLLKEKTGWILGLFPAGIFFYLLAQSRLPGLTISHPWIPSLGLELSIRLDGLALLMGLLVSGIGALILVYGGAYLHGHPYLGRFYAKILLFMSAMLGVVVSDNGLLLFIFWELTSISSFLLIGFEHEQPSARAAAWQALLVTGGGGLAMLAGFIMLSQITGSWSIQVWLNSAALVQSNPMAGAIFWLILAGAATKSAQFPFHFWLPNAMAAPTPVSAYLHSATMVKAGVYLLARLLPVLGGLVIWKTVLPVLGMVTFLASMFLMLAQHDLKRILAYSTTGALGLMVVLIGLGNKIAVEAFVVFLLAHGLYKGALFLVAGGIDHAVGSRDMRKLGNLARTMPITAAASIPAALSMAGVIPFLGFIGKELVYESGLSIGNNMILMVALILANAIMVAGALWVGWLPFFRRKAQLPVEHGPSTDEVGNLLHENSPGFWLPPVLLSILTIGFGVIPRMIQPLMGSAAQSILNESFSFKLSLWHGFNPALFLSIITLVFGVFIYFAYGWLEPHMQHLFYRLRRFGPSEGYDRAIDHLKRLAAWQTRLIQSGYLRRYVLMIVVSTVLLSAIAFLAVAPSLMKLPSRQPEPLRFYDVILVGIIITAAILVLRARSRLATIALLGTIGYSIALIYLFYSAPDLAMVQFAIETLTVILFVVVISRLPKFTRISSTPKRALDILVAVMGGIVMTLLMLMITSNPADSQLASYYLANAYPAANGRNVVNVTLVDFRGLDTLGEISVLVIAALGVLALLSLRSSHSSAPSPDNLPPSGKLGSRLIHGSIILPVAARYLMPLLLVFSVFLLLRGHNEAGGGFVGGLVAAAAFMLYGIAVSPQAALRLLPIQPRILMTLGLLISAISVSLPLFFGLPLMTGMWLSNPLPVLGKLGTPVLFDFGVYLAVIGVTLLILLSLAREEVQK